MAGTLTGLDYAVLLIVGLSVLRGLWRGLVAEIFGLIGWGVAFLAAARWAGRLVPYVPADWPGGSLTQWLVGFAVIFAGVLIVSGVISALLARFTEAAGLGPVDRSLGMLFGLVRGVLLVMALVALAGLTDLPKQPFWRYSVLRPHIERGIRDVLPLLPSGLRTYVHV